MCALTCVIWKTCALTCVISETCALTGVLRDASAHLCDIRDVRVHLCDLRDVRAHLCDLHGLGDAGDAPAVDNLGGHDRLSVGDGVLLDQSGDGGLRRPAAAAT